MISHKHKFILLHAGKCAGSSIKTALKKVINDPDANIQGHFTLAYFKSNILQLGYNFEDYKIVGLTRNPYDRMVSWYYHSVNVVKSFSGSFESFCQFRLISNNGSILQLNEKGLYARDSENLLPPYDKCDYIIRFENLQDDFNNFTSHINLPSTQLPHIQHNTERPKESYRKLYTDLSKKIVSEYFEDTISRFDYKF